MAQSKIILDSNSYLRLAKSIHPLLFQEFGDVRYCLYVLSALQKEYDREPRLQNKFPWVDDPQFHANRDQSLTLSRKQQKELPENNSPRLLVFSSVFCVAPAVA